MATEQATFKTLRTMPDMHGSANTTAEPHLQSRLVMASQVDEKNGNADNGALLSFSKIEQDPSLDSKSEDHAPLQSTHSIPASSNDEDGRVATEDEVRDILHVVDNVPGRVWVACIAGILERFVWYGATAPLRTCSTLYSTTPDVLRLLTDVFKQRITYKMLPAEKFPEPSV